MISRKESSKAIKAAWKESGLTMQQIADRLGVCKGTFSHMIYSPRLMTEIRLRYVIDTIKGEK